MTHCCNHTNFCIIHNNKSSLFITFPPWSSDFQYLVAAWASSIHFTLQTLPQQKVWGCQIQWMWWSMKSPNWEVNIPLRKITFCLVWASCSHHTFLIHCLILYSCTPTFLQCIAEALRLLDNCRCSPHPCQNKQVNTTKNGNLCIMNRWLFCVLFKETGTINGALLQHLMQNLSKWILTAMCSMSYMSSGTNVLLKKKLMYGY